jgi:hypothetical protein
MPLDALFLSLSLSLSRAHHTNIAHKYPVRCRCAAAAGRLTLESDCESPFLACGFVYVYDIMWMPLALVYKPSMVYAALQQKIARAVGEQAAVSHTRLVISSGAGKKYEVFVT